MRLILSILLLAACALLTSSTPIKQNEVSLRMNRLVRAAGKSRTTRREYGGCSAYGHSCFGGYGKREAPVPRGLPGSPGASGPASSSNAAAADASPAEQAVAAAAAAAILDDAAYRLAAATPPHPDYAAYVMRQLMPASAGVRSPLWTRGASRQGTTDWTQDIGDVANLREEDRGEREGGYTGTRLVRFFRQPSSDSKIL